MRVKVVSCFALFSLIVAFLVPGAAAGGWASAAVVDEMDPAVAGKPFTVRYVVRAHGIVGHELERMKTSVQFMHRETEQRVDAIGKDTADPTVYEVTATLPISGGWKWTVVIHNYLSDLAIDSPMPTLNVTETGQPAAGFAGASGMTTVVTITDSGFSPASLQIEAGEMVTWVNEGRMAHQVASDALGFETSPTIQPGEAFFQTIVEPGTYDYLCPPHPSMTGTIVVTQEQRETPLGRSIIPKRD